MSTSTAPEPTAAASPPAAMPDDVGGESRFLIHCCDWAGYEKLLTILGDDGPRVSYLNGAVELMSPGPTHEQRRQLLGRMVTFLTTILGIPIRSQGSTTIKRRNRQRGFEPDQCFFIQSFHLLEGQDLAPLDPMPRPDLVIEVEVASALLDKLDIYAGFGVPEIWRHDRNGLTILLLGPDGQYAVAERSLAFPFLPMVGFRQQLAAFDPAAETAWNRTLWTWVREVVAPLYQR